MRAIFLIAAVAVAATACMPQEDEPLTQAEAREALEAVQLSTEAHALTQNVVTVTTGFTLGDAAERAAENMRDFVKSQIPCAETALSDDKVLSIDFGVRGDSCIWRGKTYTGRVEAQVERIEQGVIEVTHSWIDLSDGQITVNGGAAVTWDLNGSLTDISRRVVHSSEWTSARGDGSATGDRTQRLLEGGGVGIDGERTWTGAAGNEWMLDIDGIEMRAEDPVPQAGTYTLTTPKDKTLALGFSRVDEETIKVTVGNGRNSFDFNVKRR
jgi:hypothetical protein